MEYVEFARKVAAGLRGVNQKLEDQFDEAAHAAERSFQPAIEPGSKHAINLGFAEEAADRMPHGINQDRHADP